MLESEKKYFHKMKHKNEKILNSKNRHAIKNKVNLHWWSMESEKGLENVGDYLSTVVCNYMLQKKGLSFDTQTKQTYHLYGIGSIIQGGAQNATIWGSGLKHGIDDIGYLFKYTRKLDVRLVRGPKTAEALRKKGFKCPDKFGDPAILMPLIYSPNKMEKKDKLVILHHESKLQYEGSITPVYSDYKKFIDEIYNSELVISSSLHGIILAEVYGVPAILLKDEAVDDMFKYQDYYYSTGRNVFPIAESIEEAKEMTPAPIPDFEDIMKNIVDTFPYDLWEK